MELVLIEFATASLIELALWLPPFWRWRKPLAGVLTIALALISGLLVGTDVAFWTLLILLFNAYRVINLLRLIEGRTASDYLFRVARRSSWHVMTWEAVILGLARLNHIYNPSGLLWWSGVAGLQLLIALVILSSTVRHLKTTRPPRGIKPVADRDLPSLTVAIPARNETEDLETCLQTLLANNYPK
ncbi:MAG TPA: hypothetical protein VG604_02830, partial [Candidatus Saccharimonadales bacterium]|nr:hypothetical protein [Candidatus Saccharimonadales bacterium]